LVEAARLRAQEPSKDERTVRVLDEEERIAALKRDVKALERLWSDQFTVNAPNNWVVIGKQAVLDTFVTSGVIHFSSFERTVEFVRVDGDFVFVMGAEAVRHIDSVQTVRRRFTNIWTNEFGTWRLFARHANNLVTPR
jgi:ketosteroid isomerase-like protein